MSQVSLQMACGCTLNPDNAGEWLDLEVRPQAMDIMTGEEGEEAVWDGGGFNPGRRYVFQCKTCDHVVCLNLNLLDVD